MLSGVSIRTLHFYEEVGILKPAYYGENGYRYYEEKELLLLQQILFYKELGFTIKQIQVVLGKSDFDQLQALRSHKVALSKEHERRGILLQTIDNTIKHLQGIYKMKEDEMYYGFISKEQQAEYMNYLKNKIGDDHPFFEESERKIQAMGKAGLERTQKEGDVIFRELANLKEKGVSSDSKEVQVIVLKLYNWVKHFWTPDKESFRGLGNGYTDLAWKPFFEKFDPHHPKLAKFLADGMKIFAEKNLK